MSKLCDWSHLKSSANKQQFVRAIYRHADVIRVDDLLRGAASSLEISSKVIDELVNEGFHLSFSGTRKTLPGFATN